MADQRHETIRLIQSAGDVREMMEEFIHPAEKNRIDIGGADYYGWYYAIGAALKPDSIFEQGVRFGYTASALLLGQGRTADYYGVDNEYWKGSNSFARANLARATSGYVQIESWDSADERIPTHYPKCDLVHVDANHRDPEGEMVMALMMVKTHGVVLIDDMIDKDVRKAARRVFAGHSTIALPTRQEMLVVLP